MGTRKGEAKGIVGDILYWKSNLPMFSVYEHARERHGLSREQVDKILEKELKNEVRH